MSEDYSNDNAKPDDPLGASRKTSRDPLVGTTLDGRFHIEEVLGRGGMSVVYKATQTRVNRHVAIKTMRLQVDSKPIYMERFQREIASLCALNHPNIVTVYDCLVGPDEQPYVVMDYLRGRSLEALIESEGSISLERFASISMQVCSALDHAHKKGIIHRDLKPGNVVLLDEETDFVKVVDFGLAKLNEDNRKLTQSGELWGSPPYMSPEQCMGESGDERSDIYSLGAVMYEMITGLDPFHDATTIFEFIQRHIHAVPPAFFQVNPNVTVPIKLEAAIFKALEKAPEDRFQSAQELQDAIVEACASGDSGNLVFHPSRAGRPTGSGTESGGMTSSGSLIGSGVNSGAGVNSGEASKSQQVAWFNGMLEKVDENEFSQETPAVSDRPAASSSSGADSVLTSSVSASSGFASSLPPEVARKHVPPQARPQQNLRDYPGPSGSNPMTQVWIAVAAIVLIVAGIGGAVMFMSPKPETAKTESAPVVREPDAQKMDDQITFDDDDASKVSSKNKPRSDESKPAAKVSKPPIKKVVAKKPRVSKPPAKIENRSPKPASAADRWDQLRPR